MEALTELELAEIVKAGTPDKGCFSCKHCRSRYAIVGKKRVKLCKEFERIQALKRPNRKSKQNVWRIWEILQDQEYYCNVVVLPLTLTNLLCDSESVACNKFSKREKNDCFTCWECGHMQENIVWSWKR